MKKILLLIILLFMCASPALAQYGVKGSFHVRDTLFLRVMGNDSSAHIIRIITGDTLSAALIYNKLIQTDTLLTGDRN
jgi:hypothetical protein